MKLTMRDKIFQLIGKYQSKEAFCKEKLVDAALASAFGLKTRDGLANHDTVKLTIYREFLYDLKWLLEDDDKQEEKTNE